MAGLSYTVDKTIRVVIIPVSRSGGRFSNVFQLTDGCRLTSHKIRIHKDKMFATFWVDVSGEKPFDGEDVAMPDGWDYRRMLKEEA